MQDRQSLYSQVTDRVIAELEEGRLPWVQPWDAAACGTTSVRLAARYPAFFELAEPRPISIEKLLDSADALDDDDALVLLTPGSDKTHGFIWAITRSGGAWGEIAIDGKDLADAVLAFRNGLDLASGYDAMPATTGDSADFDVAAALGLYRALFGSSDVAKVLAAKKHWILAPQGSLLSLPFAALVTEQPNSSSGAVTVAGRLRQVSWLGIERSLSILPMVSSLTSRARLRSSSATTQFFGVGDPSFEGPKEGRPSPIEQYFGDRGGHARRVQDLPALPGTRAEIEALEDREQQLALWRRRGKRAFEDAAEQAEARLSGL